MKRTLILAGLLGLATAAFAQSNGSTAPQTQPQPVNPGQTTQLDNRNANPTDAPMQTNPGDPTQTNRPGSVAPTTTSPGSTPAPDGSGTYGTMRSGQEQNNTNMQSRTDRNRRKTGMKPKPNRNTRATDSTRTRTGMDPQ